jgi:hypothetical protein
MVGEADANEEEQRNDDELLDGPAESINGVSFSDVTSRFTGLKHDDQLKADSKDQRAENESGKRSYLAD